MSWQGVVSKYDASLASTEEELDELLAALMRKHELAEEGKWNRIEEDFNCRSGKAKSKQWLKNRAKRFPRLTVEHQQPRKNVGPGQEDSAQKWTVGDFGRIHGLVSPEGKALCGSVAIGHDLGDSLGGSLSR